MINVLIVSPTGGSAGVDICLDNLVSNLDRQKFRPVVVFPEKSFLIGKFQEQDIRCYELPLRWWFPIGVKGHDFTRCMSEMRDNIDSLCDIIQIEKIDIILSNTTVSLDACIAGLLCKKKHAYFMHAMFVDNIYTEMSSQTKSAVYQFMAKSSERIVCCSEVLAEEMKSFCSNVCAINNGINTRKFSYHPKKLNDGCINLVCFGHINANKQQDFVLEALRILKQKDRNAYNRVFYTAVGPGEVLYLNALKRMVDDYGLEKHVVFEDFEENVQKRLEDFNLYVNSSITETMPLSVMEAMSSGLPVLCTRNNGNTQIVREGIDGLFCDTPEAMADNLVELLEHPERIAEMSLNARKRIEERFSVDRYVKAFESLFSEIYNDSYHVDEQFRSIIDKMYGVFTEDGPQKRLNVLSIYVQTAIATYAIAAERPLKYLSDLGLVNAKAVDISELTDKDIKNADVVFLMRFYTWDAVQLVERMHHMGKAVVWYIDDNYCGYFNGAADEDSLTKSYISMFEVSDCTVVNNPEIFQIGKKQNNRTFLLPTYQTLSRHDFEHQKPAGVVRFGFMGTLGRDADFTEVEQAVEQVIIQYADRIEVEFIGYCPEALKEYKNVHHFDFIFDYAKFRDFFEEREWDFAIAPLKNTQFNRSKTNNKYREYSSFAIPAIFSNISTYTRCVQDGVNGLLVNNEQSEWYHAICRMIEDPALREKIGQNAYKDVSENYQLVNYAVPLFHVMRMALRQPTSTMPSAVQPAPLYPSRAFTSETRGLTRRRSLFFRRTDASKALMHMAPDRYYNCLAYIPGIKCRTIHFSQPIPYDGYYEYLLQGFGNDINLFLVSGSPVPCYIEIVEDQKIIYGETRLINGWCSEFLPVGAINGRIQLRLKCMAVNGVVRTIVHSGRLNFLARPKLLGWIS